MRRTPDMLRIGAAIERPGIDPRTWTTLAMVTAIDVTAKGVYCDFTTLLGIEDTAAYAPIYGGAGYGLYLPLRVEDWVLVAVPEGDWNAGARIIARVWDEGDPPPDVVAAHPQDLALVVYPGSAIRIITNNGPIVLEANGSGLVKLGDEGAIRGVARLADAVGTTPTTALALAAALQTAMDARYTIANPLVPVTIPSGTPIGAITSASSKVVSS